jgi:hypothetical protein
LVECHGQGEGACGDMQAIIKPPDKSRDGIFAADPQIRM